MEQFLKENNSKIGTSQQNTLKSSQDDSSPAVDSQPFVDSPPAENSQPAENPSDASESPLSSALRDSLRKSKDQLERQIKTQEEQEKREK